MSSSSRRSTRDRSPRLRMDAYCNRNGRNKGTPPRHREIDSVMKKARKNGTQSTYWNKKLLEAEEKDPNRWRHSGYKELYHGDRRSSASKSGSADDSTRSRSKSNSRSRSSRSPRPSPPSRGPSHPISSPRRPRPRSPRSPVLLNSRSRSVSRSESRDGRDNSRRSLSRARSPRKIESRRTDSKGRSPGRRDSRGRADSSLRSPRRTSRGRSPRRNSRGRSPRRISRGRRLNSRGRSPKRNSRTRRRMPGLGVSSRPRSPPSRRPFSPKCRSESCSSETSSSCSNESCSVCSRKGRSPVTGRGRRDSSDKDTRQRLDRRRGGETVRTRLDRSRSRSYSLSRRNDRVKSRAKRRRKEKSVLKVNRSHYIKVESESESSSCGGTGVGTTGSGGLAGLTGGPKLSLSERFGRMAQWSVDRDLEHRNLRITAGDRLTVEMDSPPSPPYPPSSVTDLGSWDDVRVRYTYYKEHGYLRDLTLQDYIKWEQWWYKYQDWLESDPYYDRLARSLPWRP